MELLEGNSDYPTAILASNDAMAIGAAHAIREKGLQIPTDISLVGVDDIVIISYVNPTLTTVQQPLVELAEVSFTMLLTLLQGN